MTDRDTLAAIMKATPDHGWLVQNILARLPIEGQADIVLALLDRIRQLEAVLTKACNVLDELGSKQAFRLRNEGQIEP